VGTHDIAENMVRLEGLADSVQMDCMRVWDIGAGNLQNLEWSTCPARSEWEQPQMQPVDHWVSREESSRTKKRYSHQRFSFTVTRIPSHVYLNVVLPFFLITSVSGVSACLALSDTRFQVVTTCIMAGVGIRYVSSSYLPKVSCAFYSLLTKRRCTPTAHPTPPPLPT
jgi:hypothetical protein